MGNTAEPIEPALCMQLIEIVRTAQMICSESCAKKKKESELTRNLPKMQ